MPIQRIIITRKFVNHFSPQCLLKSKYLTRSLLLIQLTNLTGCLSPIALDHAVIAYDKTTTEILSKQLLLNIGRAHQHQPLHFTGVSNITATFNFQFNAGATPAFTGESGSVMTPIFGGTISENPTISIVPIEGEEFTKRLLTPMQESKLTMMLRQGADVDLILRLLASELRLQNSTKISIAQNQPTDLIGYRLFRQAVLHLSSIQDSHNLFVEPLLFDRSWQLPATTLSVEQLASLQKDFNVDYDRHNNLVTLTKRVTGHIILTNYDPALLTNQEREQLNKEADNIPANALLVDIRPNFPGGRWAMHGEFRLRSFHSILTFLGQAIDEDREFPVDKHPQTPQIAENPIQTLAIAATESAPDGAELSVKFGDQYYAVKPDNGYPWNREGFKLLYQIFQMTVSELSQQSSPSITIAK